MKSGNVSKIAKYEIAKEKARIYRKVTKQVSALEQAARKWKNKEKRQIKTEEPKKEIQKEEVPAISQLLLSKKVADPVGWVQYNPWKKEGEEKKTKRLNAATIWRFAKKLIAREWARARGIKRRDSRVYALMRQAAVWQEKKDRRVPRKGSAPAELIEIRYKSSQRSS